MRVLVLAEHLDHLFHKVVLVSAVDGDAAHFLQEPSDDRFEEFLLNHYLEFDVVVPIKRQANEEILNSCMWCNDANGVAQSFGCLVDGGPTAEFKTDFSDEFFNTHNQKIFQLSIRRVRVEKLTPIL